MNSNLLLGASVPPGRGIRPFNAVFDAERSFARVSQAVPLPFGGRIPLHEVVVPPTVSCRADRDTFYYYKFRCAVEQRIGTNSGVKRSKRHKERAPPGGEEKNLKVAVDT